MASHTVRLRIATVVVALSTLISGGCATLDRDPDAYGYTTHKASFWVQPPAEEDDSPIFGIRIPW